MSLKPNESTADRIIRLVAGVILGALALTGTVTEPVSYVALVVAAVLIVTAAIGFCPLYALLRIGTRAKTA
jgi:hypothetical protein